MSLDLIVPDTPKQVVVDFSQSDPALWYPDGDNSPLGLECWFEYNGLLLHDRTYENYYRINTLDGFFDAEVRDQREADADEEGEEEWESLYSGRTLILTGTIMTQANLGVRALRPMQNALKMAFNSLTSRPFIIHTGDAANDLMIDCRKSQLAELIEEQKDMRAWRDFQITLRCAKPWWRSYLQKSDRMFPTAVASMARMYPRTYQYSGVNGAEMRYDTHVDATLHPVAAPSAVIFNNAGTYKSRPIIEIGGFMGGLVISNAETAETLRFRSNATAGYIYTFDVLAGLLQDQFGNNRWGMFDSTNSSDTFALAPGDNPINISVSAYDSNAYVKLYWNDSYW